MRREQKIFQLKIFLLLNKNEPAFWGKKWIAFYVIKMVFISKKHKNFTLKKFYFISRPNFFFWRDKKFFASSKKNFINFLIDPTHPTNDFLSNKFAVLRIFAA